MLFHRGPSAACNFISPICFYCLLWALSEPPDLQATALAVCQARLSKYKGVKPVPLPAALGFKLMSCSMRQSAGCCMAAVALRRATLPPSSGEMSLELQGMPGIPALQLGRGSRAGRGCLLSAALLSPGLASTPPGAALLSQGLAQGLVSGFVLFSL